MLLLDIGMDAIERQVLANSAALIDKLRDVNDVEILSPLDDSRRAGIVLFTRKSIDTDALYRHLQHHDVICARRGQGIRFSPHFYTSEAVLDAAVERVCEFIG